MKRCYYEILQVDRQATPTEIKQSYRKMALKYHPDKNSDEDAKHRFVEINEAYNVLSDPNERTWYDTNREKVLFNKEEMSKEDLEQYSFGFNIWEYFTMNCYNGYEDTPGSFYAVYREVFEKIKTEEGKAYNSRQDLQEECRKYEGFGDSTTIEEKVLKFYEDWENFTTYKSFVWSEEWDTREAGNRWMRRQMEKQNKKQRQGEKKTYIKTIKDLIAYVKKRDPRFRQIQLRLKEEEEQKQIEKIEREKRKKQEKEEMKVVKQQLEEERFREVEEYFRKQNEALGQTSNQHYQQERESQFFCQICQKSFKSDNQLKNHQKSKQHKQMVKDIEREVMLKEEILKQVEEEPQPEETSPEFKNQSPKKKRNKKKKKQQQNEEESEEEKEKVEPKVKTVQPPPKVEPIPAPQPQIDESSEDEDAFMNTILNNRKKGPAKQSTETVPDKKADTFPDKKIEVKKRVVEAESSSESEEGEGRKLNKAKLKKQKKAEQQKQGKAGGSKCNVCHESFSSKTKLFDHLKKTGHASAK